MDSLLAALRSFPDRGLSISDLRLLLFLTGLCGGLAWLRQAPRLALGLIAMGAGLGLSFWLVQIRSPFGLGTDPELTRQWAQAGVNAAFGSPVGGFVWGTDEEPSLPGALAHAQVPLKLVFLLPQASALLSLAVIVLLPLALISNGRTAAFAASLAASGGVWPGVSHYESFLLRPSLILVLTLMSLVAVVASRRRGLRRRFRRSRVALVATLVGAAALRRAQSDSSESEALAPLLLLAASLILASPLRALFRRASSSVERARSLEALGLVAVFAGSGVFWFDPATTLRGYSEARQSGAALSRPLQWIVQNVPAGDLVLASPVYSSYLAALGGRRVLFPEAGQTSGVAALTQPFRRTRLLESTLAGRPVQRLAEDFGATHLFLGPGEKTPSDSGTVAAAAESTLRLVPVYQDVEDFRLFRLTKK